MSSSRPAKRARDSRRSGLSRAPARRRAMDDIEEIAAYLRWNAPFADLSPAGPGGDRRRG